MIVVLDVEYHSNCLAVYEFAAEGGKHDSLAFKRQHWNIPDLDATSFASRDTPPSSLQIDSTMKAIAAARRNLDLIRSINAEVRLNMPGCVHVRVMFSIIALLKIWFSIERGHPRLKELIGPEILDIDHCIKMARDMLMEAAGDSKNRRVPQHWLSILNECEQWREIQTGHNSTITESEFQPAALDTNLDARTGQPVEPKTIQVETQPEFDPGSRTTIEADMSHENGDENDMDDIEFYNWIEDGMVDDLLGGLGSFNADYSL